MLPSTGGCWSCGDASRSSCAGCWPPGSASPSAAFGTSWCPSTRRSPSSSAAAWCTSTRSWRLDGPGEGYPSPGISVPTDVLEDAVRVAASGLAGRRSPARGRARPRAAVRRPDRRHRAPQLSRRPGHAGTRRRLHREVRDQERRGLRGSGVFTWARLPASGCRACRASPARLLGAGRAPRPRGGPALAAHARVPRALLDEVPPLLDQLLAASVPPAPTTAGPTRAPGPASWNRGRRTTLVVASWEFAGIGYRTPGDAALALAAAARAREHREAARDARIFSDQP